MLLRSGTELTAEDLAEAAWVVIESKTVRTGVEGDSTVVVEKNSGEESMTEISEGIEVATAVVLTSEDFKGIF